MSIRWKPRTSVSDNVISFIDGQSNYSSTYFKLDDLRKKDDLLPHMVLDSDLTSLITPFLFTNLRYDSNKCLPKCYVNKIKVLNKPLIWLVYDN